MRMRRIFFHFSWHRTGPWLRWKCAAGFRHAKLLASGFPSAISPRAIWVAHIGFDRLLDYGLKDGTAFKDAYLASRWLSFGGGNKGSAKGAKK
jgi:hypothetical protein